jgi:hypothetical protein
METRLYGEANKRGFPNTVSGNRIGEQWKREEVFGNGVGNEPWKREAKK